MRISIWPAAFSLFFSCYLFPQQLTHEPLVLKDADVNLFKQYQQEYEKALNNKYDTLFRKKAEKEQYISGLLDHNNFLFGSGSLYLNWTEAEVYLQKIAKTLLKDKWTPEIKVRVVRSPDVNAYMLEDGTIYINVGFLAQVESEAELAAVIGHEYGHYAHMHSLKSYKIWLKDQNHDILLSDKLLIKFLVKQGKYAQLRDQEEDADETAAELLKSSDYNPFAIISVFRKFERMDRKYKASRNYRNSYFHDHPANNLRIDKAKAALKNTSVEGRSDFIVDRELFEKLKRQAIDESILLSLNEMDFNNAVELCYRELYSYPEDEYYLFHLNESIRRMLELDSSRATKMFITEDYSIYTVKTLTPKNSPVVITGREKKPATLEMKRMICFTAPQILFYRDSINPNSFPPSDINRDDTVKYFTYQDALDYFMKRQKKLNQSSVNFISAMRVNIQPAAFDEIKSASAHFTKYNKLFKSIRLEAPKQTDTIYYFMNIDVQKRYHQLNTTYQLPYKQDSISALIGSICDSLKRPAMKRFLFDSIRHSERLLMLNFFSVAGNISNPGNIRPRQHLIRFSDGKGYQNILRANAYSFQPEAGFLLTEQKAGVTAIINMQVVLQSDYFTKMRAVMGDSYPEDKKDMYITIEVCFINGNSKEITWRRRHWFCNFSELRESLNKVFTAMEKVEE